MDWFDSPGDLAAICAVVAAIFGVLIYLIKSETSRISAEFKPNHGGSMHDLIVESGKRVDLVITNQSDILHQIEILHTSNDAMHDRLAQMVERVSGRLDAHAQSPVHDRRADDARRHADDDRRAADDERRKS
jgi:hypothetical protein